MQSYSLWLEPSRGPLKTKLESRIHSLGGPAFQPHVTLVPGFQAQSDEAAISAAKTAVQGLKTYRITFDKVSYGSSYFQCVYILCKPTQEVMDANRLARESLGVEAGGTYMPHLSLLYSDAAEDHGRKVAASEQQLLFHEADDQEGKLGFDVTAVSVWSTQPDDLSLQSWKQLAVLPVST